MINRQTVETMDDDSGKILTHPHSYSPHTTSHNKDKEVDVSKDDQTIRLKK